MKPDDVEMEEVLNKIFFEVLAWHSDEGEYQPTVKEAKEKIKTLILNFMKNDRTDRNR